MHFEVCALVGGKSAYNLPAFQRLEKAEHEQVKH